MVGSERVEIVEIDPHSLEDVNRLPATFEVTSTVVIHVDDREFRHEIVDLPESYTKTYPNDHNDYSTYIDNPDRIVYFVHLAGELAGQVVLRRNWNVYAYVEDIRVKPEHRRKGIGRALMNAALAWVKQGNMPGIMLETQDNNVPAVLFYQSLGFKLGGYDKYLYKGGNPSTDEAALYMYLTL